MKWIFLLLIILFSGTLLAIPPMPEWIQPDQEKKKPSGSSTVSSRTFVIKLEEQNTIIDQQPVDWDYKPSCASFLKCKFADGKDYSGQVKVADIGFPKAALEDTSGVECSLFKSRVCLLYTSPRPRDRG